MYTVATLIWRDTHIKLESLNVNITDQELRMLIQDRWGISIHNTRNKKYSVRWIKPGIGRYKLNTDGSLRAGTGYWGEAIRNEKGAITRVAHRRCK